MSTLTSANPAGVSAYEAERRSRAHARDSEAALLERYQRADRYYYRELIRLFRLQIPDRASVLQVGCGMGDLLAGVCPAHGVGIDSSGEVIDRAQRRHPHLSFVAGDPETTVLDEQFDYVILGDAVSELADVQACFESVKKMCKPSTRIIISYYNALWEPVLKALSTVGLRRKTGEQNWLSTGDVKNLLQLSGFDVISHNHEIMLPVGVPLISTVCNRLLARVWPTQHLGLVNMLIARVQSEPEGADELTTSVIVPTLNERGNVEDAVNRTPELGKHTEIIFVDGNSKDNTADEVRRVIDEYPDKDIKLICQGDGVGKGDAVRKGFAAASGDVLMILDGDLTVMPEELPKFFDCLASGKAEFVNGTRLVYPMEDQAMRTLNKMGNWFFSKLFSWLLRQRFRDTLCGTKVLLRKNYENIASNRHYFGEFDPFGDFDLIFGAAKANLKTMDLPVRYKARTYGSTEISRFRHGLLLLKMSFVALWKLRLR